MKIAIKGVGVVGGFGCGVGDMEKALPNRRIAPEKVSTARPDGGADLSAFLADTSPLEQFTSRRSLRRIDHFSRMALLGAYLALQDAGGLDDAREKLGTVIATGYGATRTTFGFLDSVMDEGDFCASPTLFSSSVHNAAAANVSILLKATGPSLTVTQFEMSVPSALLTACLWLEEGRVDRVLFGGVDEYCDVLGYCRRRLFKEGCGRMPPDPEADGRSLAGEGAAFFLLTRYDGDAPVYGTIVDVRTGSVERRKPRLPLSAVLFLSAGGTGRRPSPYHRIIGQGHGVAVYRSLYGDLPSGPAFDMAIAALAIKRDRVFASADCPDEIKSLDVITDPRVLGSRPICCVKCGGGGNFGVVTLVKSE